MQKKNGTLVNILLIGAAAIAVGRISGNLALCSTEGEGNLEEKRPW